MASSNQKSAEEYLPSLWHSFVQVIIQSRLGKKAKTRSKSPSKTNSMFSIEINNDEEITDAVRKYMGNDAPTPENPFSVEIQLQTKDGEGMVLEIWTFSIEDLHESDGQVAINDSLSLLLKAAISISRITPAFPLSFRQGQETFIILYRLYTDPPNFESLGDKREDLIVGEVVVNNKCLSISVVFRKNLTISKQPRATATVAARQEPYEPQPMMVKSDHFKIDSPHKSSVSVDRNTDSSDTGLTSGSSSLQFNLSNSDLGMLSTLTIDPRSRTNSEYRSSPTPLPPLPKMSVVPEKKKLICPFANPTQKEISEEDEDCPFAALIASCSAPPAKTKADALLSLDQESEDDAETSKAASKAATPRTETAKLSSSSHSNKSLASNITGEDSGFLLVNNPPFATSRTNDCDPGLFFREWQLAPPLRLFNDVPIEALSVGDGSCSLVETVNFRETIRDYEKAADGYDEFVRSLNLDADDEGTDDDDFTHRCKKDRKVREVQTGKVKNSDDKPFNLS